jgi:cytochrome c oxidase cbb3-type subunit 1
VLASLMLIATACPRISRVTEFTWFGPAQTQLQLYGFFAMTMFGAVYHLLPRVAGFDWPFPKLARVHFWLSLSGVLLLVLPLAIGGLVQGMKLNHPDVGFMDAMNAVLPFLRVSTIGLMLLLFGNLLFALNIFGLAFVWEKALVKKAFAVVTASLETEDEAGSASASLRRDKEVRA